MIHNNIELVDAAVNTKYPFEHSCSLKLSQENIKPNSFIAVKLYIFEDMSMPARLSSIVSEDEGNGYIVFSDSNGTAIGKFYLYKTFYTATSADTTANSNTTYPYTDDNVVSDFIYNDNNIIVGHCTLYKDTCLYLLHAAKIAGGTYYTAVDDFILLPECCVLYPEGYGRCFSINNTSTTNNVTIVCGSRVKCDTQTGSSVFKFSLLKPLDTTVNYNGICVIKVNNTVYNVAGSNLFIKANALSNLRVEQDSSSILLKGVMDA